MLEIKHRDTDEVLHTVFANALSGADLQDAVRNGKILFGADLSNANLSTADLTGIHLSRAILHKTNLNYTILQRAVLSGADISAADLFQADLSHAMLPRTNLRGANLRDANLRDANLSNADLSNADLSWADLTRAYLNGADLSGAILSETNLSNCPTLHQAKGLETIVHRSASSLDMRTLRACATELPDVFLSSVGYNPLIAQLQRLVNKWDENKDNQTEEFWQEMLTSNFLVLSQVFSLPVVLLENKAYAGGKRIDNTGGGIVDFLLMNSVTENVGLVEIKTPSAPLLSLEYRAGVFSPSKELSGAVIQVLDYKDKLTKQYHTQRSLSQEDGLAMFRSFNPQCVVIAGNFKKQMLTEHQKKSFDLFRSGWKDVLIITFDELFEKIKNLNYLADNY